MPPTPTNQHRLRIAAISFLNPAPLLYSFEHAAPCDEIYHRYETHYTLPSQCAAELASGESDLGLIPIASLAAMPGVAGVPGCVIASLHQVRSIQLVLKPGVTLSTIRTLAADAASRSSVAYLRVLLRQFYGCDPAIRDQPADLTAMLCASDAALLIGDPALLAIEAHETANLLPDHTWIDLAELWRRHTGLPWVAAVWAVRTAALQRTGIPAAALNHDLLGSRDAGLANLDTIIRDWQPRLPLSAATIRRYLTENIHYALDPECLRAIEVFYQLAAETGVLPAYRMQIL